MKKLMILVVAVILMFASSVFADCTETDDGQDFAVKGTTTYSKDGKVISETIDQCLDENRLEENFCDSAGKSDIIRYDCPGGCEEGACINTEEPTEKEEVVEELPEEVTEEEETVEIAPEEPETEEPEVTPTKTSKDWIWILAIVLAIVAAGMFLKKKKKKEVVEIEKKVKAKGKKEE